MWCEQKVCSTRNVTSAVRVEKACSTKRVRICSIKESLCSVIRECTVSGGLQLQLDDMVCGVTRKSSL